MGIGQGAIRAGQAFVELFADDNRLYRALNTAQARVKAFAASVQSIGIKAAAAGGGPLAPLGKAFFDAAGKGRDVDQLARRFGLTTQSVSALGYAFETAGVNFEEFDSTLEGLSAKVKGAADNNAQLIDGLKGLNGRFLINLPLDKQLEVIADKFKTIRNPIDQANVATELFGASGLRLLPVLKQGAAGIQRLKEEAQGAGAIVSPEEAAQSTAVFKAMNAVWIELGNTVRTVGFALLPATDGTRDLAEMVRGTGKAVREWIGENRGLIVVIAKLAGGLVVGGTALITFSFGLSKLAGVLGLVVSTLKLVASGVLLLLNPLGLVTAAVVAIGAHWLTTSERGQKASRDLMTAFKAIGSTFNETMGGITAAVKSGNLELAFKIAATGVKSIWFQMLVAMGKAFAAFIEDNREKLIALGAIMGGVRGGKLGARLGPWGAVGGGVLGGAGGALAADELADALAGLGNNPGLEAKIADANRELRELVAQAKGIREAVRNDDQGNPFLGAALANMLWAAKHLKPFAEPPAPQLANSVKGVFSGPIAQQLAYGDQTQRRQLDAAIENVKVNKQVLAAVIELGKGRLKFR